MRSALTSATMIDPKDDMLLIQAEIGAAMRLAYNPAVQEPLPPEMASLLARLAATPPKTARREPQETAGREPEALALREREALGETP